VTPHKGNHIRSERLPILCCSDSNIPLAASKKFFSGALWRGIERHKRNTKFSSPSSTAALVSWPVKTSRSRYGCPRAPSQSCCRAVEKEALLDTDFKASATAAAYHAHPHSWPRKPNPTLPSLRQPPRRAQWIGKAGKGANHRPARPPETQTGECRVELANKRGMYPH